MSTRLTDGQTLTTISAKTLTKAPEILTTRENSLPTAFGRHHSDTAIRYFRRSTRARTLVSPSRGAAANFGAGKCGSVQISSLQISRLKARLFSNLRQNGRAEFVGIVKREWVVCPSV